MWHVHIQKSAYVGSIYLWLAGFLLLRGDFTTSFMSNLNDYIEDMKSVGCIVKKDNFGQFWSLGQCLNSLAVHVAFKSCILIASVTVYDSLWSGNNNIQSTEWMVAEGIKMQEQISLAN